jgi:hypothetical protein
MASSQAASSFSLLNDDAAAGRSSWAIMPAVRPLALAVVLPLAMLGCGEDEQAEAASCTGVCLVFEPEANLDDPAHFFDVPYPSDLRADEAGRPRLAGFPNPLSLPFVAGLVENAAETRGFPVIPVAHFRFTGELAPRSASELIPAQASSPILLIDIDDGSPDRGKLLPVISETHEADAYVPEHLLSVAPRPGFVLRPRTVYAVVVRRAALDASGAELGPLPRAESFDRLWPVLEELGIDASEVSAATLFTTGDVVADQQELSERLVEKYDLAVTDLALAPEPTAPELCILRGKIEYPQFQTGAPPFDTEGRFTIGSDGLPIEQRREVAPVVIVLPNGQMPAGGYPLVVNIHGSGGWSIAMVRPVGDDGLPGAPIGPAFPYTQRGLAVAGSAMPLNPERFPGASETEYLNVGNLAAMRDTFRQGQIEQRLLVEALLALRIDGNLVTGCGGPSLPAGASAFAFDPENVFAVGQSMGAMYTNQLAAIDPRIRAIVPTGAGGHWTEFILNTPLQLGAIPGLLRLLLATGPLSMLHPVVAIGAAGLEPADPVVYVPRIARRPLPGHPVRSIYQPVAPNDSYFASVTYDTMTLAYQHPQAGPEQWPELQQALALARLEGVLEFPIEDNLRSESGEPYTGAVIPFPPLSDPGGAPVDGHAIYVYRDDEKYQYSCFLRSVVDTGRARIPGPVSDWKAPCR